MKSDDGIYSSIYKHTEIHAEHSDLYFNAENIDILLGEKCGKKYEEGENWAKQNNIQLDTSLFVEIYPEGMFDMEFPEMYYLCKVKE